MREQRDQSAHRRVAAFLADAKSSAQLDPSRRSLEGAADVYVIHQWCHVELLTVLPNEAYQQALPAHDTFVGLDVSLDAAGRMSTSYRHQGARVSYHPTDGPYFPHQIGDHQLYLRFADADDAGLLLVHFDVIAAQLVTDLRRQAQQVIRKDRRRQDGPAGLRAWIDLTRATAAGTSALVDEGTRAAMLEAAALAELNLSWPSRHFEKAPATAKQLDEWRFSLLLWVVDQLVRACNQFQPYATSGGVATINRADVLREILPGDDSATSATASPARRSEKWKQRVKRLQKAIRDGHSDHLVADVLESLLPTP